MLHCLLKYIYLAALDNIIEVLIKYGFCYTDNLLSNSPNIYLLSRGSKFIQGMHFLPHHNGLSLNLNFDTFIKVYVKRP